MEELRDFSEELVCVEVPSLELRCEGIQLIGDSVCVCWKV